MTSRAHADGLLAGVTLLCAAGMVVPGRAAGLGYDDGWHLWVARQPSAADFLAELLANPHPPLYHLLLRAVSAFGDGPPARRGVTHGGLS